MLCHKVRQGSGERDFRLPGGGILLCNSLMIVRHMDSKKTWKKAMHGPAHAAAQSLGSEHSNVYRLLSQCPSYTCLRWSHQTVVALWLTDIYLDFCEPGM